MIWFFSILLLLMIERRIRTSNIVVEPAARLSLPILGPRIQWYGKRPRRGKALRKWRRKRRDTKIWRISHG